jgi:hypothetical protein
MKTYTTPKRRKQAELVRGQCDGCTWRAVRDESVKLVADMGRYQRVTGFQSEVRRLCEVCARGLVLHRAFAQTANP